MRIVASVVLLAFTSLLGADVVGAVTGTPSFAIGDTTIARGSATTFTTIFTMDEGTAQATLNLQPGLIGTFPAACTLDNPGGGRTCTVSPTGSVTVSDGGPPGVDNVTVTMVGTIAASADMPLTSTEGSDVPSAVLTPLSITLDQGASPQTSVTRTLTVTSNPATDAEVQITTTAPTAGATAGRGQTIDYTATLERVGFLAQATSASVTLVADTAAGTAGPLAAQVVSWIAGETDDKNVTLTVSVPASLALGGTATYHILVEYDANTASAPVSLDREVGDTRSFTIVPGTGDAVITINPTAPSGSPTVARGSTVTYTATLTRSGNTSQATSVALSLVADADQGSTAGSTVTVDFASGDTSATRSITVTVPPSATLGTATYHFQAVYDPNGIDGSPLDTVTSAPRSFVIAVAPATFELTASTNSVARGDAVTFTATLDNPTGGETHTGTQIVVTLPSGVAAGTPTATGPLLPTQPTVVGQIVTVNYATIAPGEIKTLTIPATVLSTATKVDGSNNDLVATATFASVAPLKLVDDSEALELTPWADLQMRVSVPNATESLEAPTAADPQVAAVPATYSVLNAGPDPAAGVSFVITAPAGFTAVSVNEGGDGPDADTADDWSCTAIAVGGTSFTCTYQGGDLTASTTTEAVVVTWTFDSTGVKDFKAVVSATTFDQATGNNTETATVTITEPQGAVNITASAPTQVVVDAENPGIVIVTYTITNSGPKNIKAQVTVSPPTPLPVPDPTNPPPVVVLESLQGGGCNVTTDTQGAVTCSTIQLNKNGPAVVVTARYRVPQGFFAAQTDQKVTFTASLTAVNGIFAGDSVTTASATVQGVRPTIDIGLADLPNPTIFNLDFGTLVSAAAPALVPMTFTFQNFSTEFPVRSGTAFIELTLPAAGTVSPPATGCTVVSATLLRCPVPVPAAAIAPAPAGGSSTATLTLTLKVNTADPVEITATSVVLDEANRIIAANAATPDTRTFQIDVNRRPKPNDEVGPGIPSGGVMKFSPVGSGKLHEDLDAGDVLALAMIEATPTCAPAAAGCDVVGGTVTGLTYEITNDTITVTFTGVTTPAAAPTPVTAKINYSVSDGKSSVPSSVTVKLLEPVRYDGLNAVAGSFGTPPPGDIAPRSFGEEVGADRTGPVPTVLEVLEGALGTNANGAAFSGDRTYDLTLADATTLDVTPDADTGVSVVPSEVLVTPVRNAVRYVPPRAYTSDAPITVNVGLEVAPADSFKYRTTGRRGTQALYTVDIPAVVHVKNQEPIGIDSPFTVPNGVTQKVFPANNDLDGNTLEDPIRVKSTAKDYFFDDEGVLTTLDGDRRLKIKCIGPLPATAEELQALLDSGPDAKCPKQDVNPPAPGWKRAGDPLVLETPDSKGKVTVTLEGGTGTDAFRGITASADSTVVGDLDFAYVVVDNYGGASFAKATAQVPNSPPQVIEGVRTVLKNTPTVVVDTRLAAQDANGDTIEVSGTSERTEHGTSKIGDLNRTITYTPDRDYLGPDKLLYNVSDGRRDGSASAELQINVIEQPGAITDAGGGAGSGAGGSGAPGGKLAATGGDPLALTLAAGCALVLGLALVQAGKRRQSLPLLDRARHLRT